jgi:hypothetical protein
MPLRAPNLCTGQNTFTGTLGVMARQSQSSTLWGFSAVALDIFDLTNPAAPCRFGVKNLAGTNLENPGAYEGVGYAKSVALLSHESGVLAFTAIQFIGLTSTDIGQVIGNDAPKVKAPIVPGNYRSVDVNGGKVIALEQSAARVDVFDPSLSQLASVSLSLETEPFELDVVDAFQIDRNEDGHHRARPGVGDRVRAVRRRPEPRLGRSRASSGNGLDWRPVDDHRLLDAEVVLSRLAR